MDKLIASILAAFMVFAAGGAAAQSTVEARDAWARASAGMTRAGAAYLTLVNRGGEADRLISASSPAAARTELHEIVKEGEIMRMRQIEAIPVGPGATVALKPGGLHVMLLDLTQPLKPGDRISLTLTFERSGQQVLEVPVNAVGSMGPAGHAPSGMHGGPGGGKH